MTVEAKTTANMPILIVDDEPLILRGVSVALSRAGIENVVTMEDPRQVMAFLEETPAAAIVLDLQMPYISGKELLPLIRRRFSPVPVIVLTANSELETAVTCMKNGAYDYHVKPVNPERLIDTVKRALDVRELQGEVASLRSHILGGEIDESSLFSRFITVNDGMRSVLRYAEAIAKTRSPVLLCGEAGVGKGPMARAIHEASGRPGSFIAINVAGMSEDEFIGTVFGSRPGALAQAGQVGEHQLPAAREGTIYLEGIDSLDLGAQARILEVIEHGTYHPLEAGTPLRTNVRVLVSVSSDRPEEAVEGGRILPDLFLRLKGHLIRIPALRERIEDIPVLLSAFVEDACRELAVEKPVFPSDLVVRLLQYGFPGNAAELETMVRDAVHGAAAGGSAVEALRKTVEALDFSGGLPGGEEDGEAARSVTGATRALMESFGHFPTMDEATDFLIDEAIKVTKGNKRAAAALLRITRQTINRRMRLRN